MTTNSCLHTGGCMRAKSEQNQGNRKRDHRFLVSATHMCMCTLNWASLVSPQSSVHVCAKTRQAAKSRQHPFQQYTCLPVSATHMRVKSHVHGHHQMSTAIRKQPRQRNHDHGFLASATHICVQNHWNRILSVVQRRPPLCV